MYHIQCDRFRPFTDLEERQFVIVPLRANEALQVIRIIHLSELSAGGFAVGLMILEQGQPDN